MGENQGTCVDTGKAARKNPSVYGKRYVGKVWFGTGETLPVTEGKEKAYKLGENVFLMGGSRRGT